MSIIRSKRGLTINTEKVWCVEMLYLGYGPRRWWDYYWSRYRTYKTIHQAIDAWVDLQKHRTVRENWVKFRINRVDYSKEI